MASDNRKTTYHDNTQKVSTPIFILQTDTRGSGTQHQRPSFLQHKIGKGLGSPADNPPGLWIRVPGPHRDSQPII